VAVAAIPAVEAQQKTSVAAPQPGVPRTTIRINVNGVDRRVEVEDRWTLVELLRDHLELTGTKVGCDRGECGACTVLLDGVPTRACVTTAEVALGREVTTLEGLGTRTALHPVQQAFIDEQAAQCGYCLNGMIMTAKALLDRDPHPTVATIQRELSRNLCRCGTHVEIVRAVQRAAQLLAAQKDGHDGARV
jgi:nicotinate dehydrogenase subunit A